MANETLLAQFFIPEMAGDLLSYSLQDGLQVLRRLTAPGGEVPCILLENKSLQKSGEYFTQPFWKKAADLVTRKDLTSASDATLVQFGSDYEKSPVISKKIGPSLFQRPQLAQAGAEGFTAEFAKQASEQVKLALETLVLATLKGSAAAFIAGAGGAGFPFDHAYSVWDNSTPVNLSIAALANGRAEMGDRIDKILGWIMRSEPANDMRGGQIALTSADWGEGVARGRPLAQLGLPEAIVDSTHLKTDAVASSSTKSKWYTYGLGPGCIMLDILSLNFDPPQPAVEKEMNGVYLRGDLVVRVRVPGMNYAGAANPADSTLANSASWAIKAQDHREFSIVRIETNCSAT